MSRLRTITLSTLLAAGLVAVAPLGAFAADLQGSVSQFTPGSTPRDNSNATGSIARGGPVFAMSTSRFSVGSTPLDTTDAGSSAGM